MGAVSSGVERARRVRGRRSSWGGISMYNMQWDFPCKMSYIASYRLLKICKLLTHMINKVLYWGIVSHCSLFSAIMCWGWGS